MATAQPLWKSAIGWFLFVFGVVLYSIQQTWGIWSFPHEYDKQLFLFVLFSIMMFGMTAIVSGPGILSFMKHWAIGMACIYTVFTIANGLGLVYDSSTGSNIYLGSYYSILDASGSSLSTYNAITNVVLSCVPIAIVIMNVMWVMVGDGGDDYGTAVIECIIEVGIIIGVAFLFQLTLGINIFQPF